MEEQVPESDPALFSFWGTALQLPQVSCYLSYTHAKTHQCIADNLSLSPLYSGAIKGIGPRYCPSIEDKVVKFPTRERHAVFFEPESLESHWIYPNGISTSLPADVQLAFLRTIPGCARAELARPGYAVEYDCIQPTQLSHTLESKQIKGLFIAGQVNGTSGYEEAAGQGLVAGINAALQMRKEPHWIPRREESYLGVMIDDLVAFGVTEPYRMFTSRAEYRLSLREDNADLRLASYGASFGLLTQAQEVQVEAKRQGLKEMVTWLHKLKGQVAANSVLGGKSESESSTRATQKSASGYQLLKRPHWDLKRVLETLERMDLMPDCKDWIEALEIEIKYEGYIHLQRAEIERLSRMDALPVPQDFDFSSVRGLSTEAVQKLCATRPNTLAEAARIPGLTKGGLTALLFGLKKTRKGGDRGETPRCPSP